MTFEALRRTLTRTMRVSAPPSVVFPLLCPVREREWIDGWDADVLRSESGLAELGCVFIARPGGRVGPTFVITRHEPDSRVEFALFHGVVAERLIITVAPVAGGSELVWRREYTALSPEGNAWMEANLTGQAARLEALEGMLAKHLASKGHA